MFWDCNTKEPHKTLLVYELISQLCIVSYEYLQYFSGDDDMFIQEAGCSIAILGAEESYSKTSSASDWSCKRGNVCGRVSFVLGGLAVDLKYK